ncbi:MAG TPA: RluA family pseudouridine synthase [Dermatophilaceae bacterium]|nr:RluA family pseudouridine synthase [Dermatophilaceae bacterium]
MSLPRLVEVPEGLDGQRLDAALARLFGLSRTRAAHIVAAGGALLDDRVAGKSDRVRAGATLEVTFDASPPAVVEVVAEPVPGMSIVHDDDDLVVVNKPAWVAAHPGVGWSGPTVVGGLAAAGYRIATSGPHERQGIVSRLDVGTSGLMVVAKSEYAYGRLKRAFKQREVDKSYHALVQGLPDPLSGTIDAPIGRRPSAEFKFAVLSTGKPARTHYQLREAYGCAALLEVTLETGRTHQIRVHLAAVRHPCVGDPLYGADPRLAGRLGLERQWLHAVGLGFEHPRTGERLRLTSDYPDDLARALERLAP